MDVIKSNYKLLSTVLFIISIVIAHLFSTMGYNWTKNTISDLGAQGYPRKFIIQAGFLSFGITLALGIIIDGLTWKSLPILIYALCVALTGIFCTKPFFEVSSYSMWQSHLHALFAQVAGVAFSLGILLQLFSTPHIPLKYIHLTFFLLVIGLSLTFGLVTNYQGITQRVLYLVSFIWLVKFFEMR